MTAVEHETALEQATELVTDRARLELFAEHVIAELQASLRTSGTLTVCYLTADQALQLIRLGQTALGIGNLPAPRVVEPGPSVRVHVGLSCRDSIYAADQIRDANGRLIKNRRGPIDPPPAAGGV